MSSWRYWRQRVGRQLAWTMAEEREVRGISVRVALQFEKEPAAAYLDEMERAVELVAEFVPKWFVRGRGAIRGIAVWDAFVLGGAGTYNRLDSICSFRPMYVLGPSTNRHLLASFILHEFVHAWAHQEELDLPRYQTRVERLCRVVQFAGAKRMGCDPSTLRSISRYLESTEIDLDPAERLRAWIKDAEEWDVPNWYRRWFLARNLRRARRRLSELDPRPEREAHAL